MDRGPRGVARRDAMSGVVMNSTNQTLSFPYAPRGLRSLVEALLSRKLGFATHGVAQILDENGPHIEVKFNIPVVLLVAVAPTSAQILADQLLTIEDNATPDGIQQLARPKAARQLCIKTSDHTDDGSKTATLEMVCRNGLLEHLHELDANEPPEEGFTDHREELVLADPRIADPSDAQGQVKAGIGAIRFDSHRVAVWIVSRAAG